MARGKGVVIPVSFNIEDATKDAEAMAKKIEAALEKHQGSEDPRIVSITKGLEKMKQQIQDTAKFRDKLTSGSAEYQDLMQLANQWSVVEKNTRSALNEYKEYLRSIGKENLVDKFSEAPNAIDKRYFGKNRTPEITEQIEKLKELYNAWARASAEKEKYAGMAWNASPNDLTTSESEAIAKNFTKASDAAEIFLLKLAQIENQEKRVDKAGGNTSFRRNFYIIRTLANDISRALTALESKLKQFASGLAGVAKKMFHLNKESRKTTTSLNNGFKHALQNVLRYGFGIRSLFFLFRRLRKYALEALGEMAKAFPEVNTQMSRAVTALNQMKGALGTAIQPLLTVVVPVLEKIAALISKIMGLIGGVIATLTGQGKIYQAVATQTDYAASLDKTGAAAKKAKKELEGYLSPIDEINKYQSQKDDDDGAGAGAGGAGYKMTEVPIPDYAKKVADFIKRLIEPIKKAWKKMGDFVKKSWKYAMDEVLKLGKSIARDFWKVWEEYDTQKIFENIFETIGWIGQAVGNLAKRFREAWDKNDTGLRILRAIRDIILVITEHIRDMAKATAEWADNLNFEPLLTAFADWLESLKNPANAIMGILKDFYTQVILPLGEWAVEVGGPKLLKVFTDFNKEVKWDELRTKLSELWAALEPFAQTIGEGVIMFIDELSDAVANFLNSQKFKDFIDLCIKWMNEAKPEDVASTIKTVAGAIITLKGALFLLEGIKTLNTTVTAIRTFLSLFGAGGAAAGAASTMKDVGGAAETLGSGIGVLRNQMSLFGNMLFDAGGTVAFFDNIKQINKQGDIYKLSDDLQKGKISLEEYQKAVDKLNDVPIAEAGYSWKQFWKDFFNPVDGKDMGQALTSLFGMLKDNTHTYRGEVKALTAEYAQGTITTTEYNKKLDELKERYTVNGKLVEDTSLKTVKSLDDIKSGAANMASSVIKDNDSLNKSFNGVKEKTTYSVKTVENQVYNSGFKIEGTVNSLQQTVDTNNTKINKSVDDMTNTVKQDSNSAKTELDKSMTDMSNSVSTNTNTIKTKTDEIKSAFDKSKWTFRGVADGLGETFKNAVNKVRDYWNPLADSLSGSHTVFGKTFNISLPKIPRLAQGAVIPPNKEFMAMLGDQKSGTNIETPLSTMIEAFNTALSQNGANKTEITFVTPDRRTLAKYVLEGGRIMQTSTGRNPFELA